MSNGRRSASKGGPHAPPFPIHTRIPYQSSSPSACGERPASVGVVVQPKLLRLAGTAVAGLDVSQPPFDLRGRVVLPVASRRRELRRGIRLRDAMRARSGVRSVPLPARFMLPRSTREPASRCRCPTPCSRWRSSAWRCPSSPRVSRVSRRRCVPRSRSRRRSNRRTRRRRMSISPTSRTRMRMMCRRHRMTWPWFWWKSRRPNTRRSPRDSSR